MRWTLGDARGLIPCGRTALMRTAKSCGPDTPTLVSSLAVTIRETTGANKPGPRGDHVQAVTPLRREDPVFRLNLWFLPRAFFTARGPWGSVDTRPSLRPCVQKICQNVRTGGSDQPPVAGAEPVAPQKRQKLVQERGTVPVSSSTRIVARAFEPVPSKEGSG